jgi:asparagine synthase (glutamine-hydrolysing)
MFRYLGFSWNPEHPAQAVIARRLEEAIQRAPGWQPALSGRALRVYTVGNRHGANGFHPLPLDRGVIVGRLFRRRDGPSESGDLELSPREGDKILKTDGQALVDDYWGRYTAVLQSSRRGACLLRDPSGALPCYLRNVEGVAVFFSWLEDLIAFTPDAPGPRVSWEAVAALAAHGHLGGRRTALEDVSQVLPGQLTPLDESAHSPVALWSAVAIARKRVEPEPDIAAAQLRRVAMDCVHAWSSCYDAILLRLSGGLDSAILLGSLSAGPTGTRITCLNYHSAGSDSDERGFARLAARRAGVELIERERDAAFRLDDILAASRTPVPVTHVGRMDAGRIDAEVAAAHHARAMFTGGGGDQLFFQRHCTWPAADYLSVHGLGRGFVRASLDAARLGRVSLRQSMRRALADQGRRTVRWEGIGRSFTLGRREAIDGMRHPDRYIHPDLASAADLPIGKFHQVRDLIDPAGYYDPYHREAAPELVNPLLSQPLIELCLELPTWLLSHGGRSRALARRAFAGDIPREIAARQSKGGMEEHATTILRRNLSLARELLLDGRLVRAGLLDRNMVEAALACRLSGLGTHVSEIHHYIAIEAWLRSIAASPDACWRTSGPR